MAELKTRPTGASVTAFVAAITDETRRKDCKTLDGLMRRATRDRPRMWGPSIVGYGRTTYTYADGRVLDWPVVGFSPRSQALTVYIMGGLDQHAALLKRLGKYKRSAGGCLYLKDLADVDLDALETICARAHAQLQGSQLAGRQRKRAKRAR